MQNTFKPILFSTEMVQAILDDRKTQTRRILEGKTTEDRSLLVNLNCGNDAERSKVELIRTNKIKTGNILWVREAWKHADENDYEIKYQYKQDIYKSLWEYHKFKPSIHMPKEAARIFLKVTDVRAERLQDISEEDAIAEGIKPGRHSSVKSFFIVLWQKINGKKYPWESNPWVWVYTFERVEKPADFL